MKKMFCRCMFLCIATSIQTNATEMEIMKKGRVHYNRCCCNNGKCASFIAEADDGSNTYFIPDHTTVFYDPEFAGPYLPGTYPDADGRMRIDNVSVTIGPSDCVDPDTGEVIDGCTVGVDEDMNFSIVGGVSVAP